MYHINLGFMRFNSNKNLFHQRPICKLDILHRNMKEKREPILKILSYEKNYIFMECSSLHQPLLRKTFVSPMNFGHQLIVQYPLLNLQCYHSSLNFLGLVKSPLEEVEELAVHTLKYGASMYSVSVFTK